MDPDMLESQSSALKT